MLFSDCDGHGPRPPMLVLFAAPQAYSYPCLVLSTPVKYRKPVLIHFASLPHSPSLSSTRVVFLLLQLVVFYCFHFPLFLSSPFSTLFLTSVRYS